MLPLINPIRDLNFEIEKLNSAVRQMVNEMEGIKKVLIEGNKIQKKIEKNMPIDLKGNWGPG